MLDLNVVLRKRCSRCGEVKPLNEYHRDSAVLSGVRAKCKACVEPSSWRPTPEQRRAYARGWYAKNRDRESLRKARGDKFATHRRRFGIGREEYEEMLARQGGVCAICGTDSPGPPPIERFAIDHDHSCCPTRRTARKTCGSCVRGLLCNDCNNGLGRFHDDPETLVAAAAYLLQRQDVLGPIA